MTSARTWDSRVGELAVYPGQGVARIEELETQWVGGEELEFVVLRKLEDDSRILIPRGRIDDVGLRPVIAKAEAVEVWGILKRRKRGRRKTGVAWTRQIKDLQERIQSGSIFEIAEVLRDLLRLQIEKELSFGERKLLENARSLLVQELAAAERKPPERVEADIKDAIR